MFGIKKNFGFGCMRLPMKDGAPDTEEFSRMVDIFIGAGFNYFDTAHGYHRGASETALKASLTSRYPRESYILTDKLSDNYFNTNGDIRPFFESQLDALGVDYLDFYLMHAQDGTNYKKYRECRAYEEGLRLRDEGKIRHFGISFHDRAEVLERILTDYPEIEAVQIQFNYLDYDEASVQSRLCWETCRRHGKPVIVMEPVKGGSLAKAPEGTEALFEELGISPSELAIRFAASFDGVMMVLSGMSSVDMVTENVGFMRDFKPLDEREREAVDTVRRAFEARHLIPCTSCRYCTERCPVGIPIPEIFSCLNTKEEFGTWNSDFYYSLHTANAPKASECLECGACEEGCPQHIGIRELLKKAAETFEKKE